MKRNRASDDNNISIKSHDDNNISISDTTTNGYNNGTIRPTRDKITTSYAVSVNVINNKFWLQNRVHTINNIIEYADALTCKFNDIGLGTANQLYLAVIDGP